MVQPLCLVAVCACQVRVRGRMRAVALDDEVWLSSHISLWRAARCARRWLQGFRARRDDALLALGEAGCTETEMGEVLASEVRGAVACRDRCIDWAR